MTPPPRAPRKTPPDAADGGEPVSAVPRKRKPWQAPRVRTGHLFESNSLACGKNTPQLEQCLQNPVTS